MARNVRTAGVEQGVAVISSALHHWHELTHDEQRAAIRRMAAEGLSEYVIAAATRLSVEFVRQQLAGKPSEARAS